MPVDQDWGNVWPTARTFHPASVPLPLHQGYVPPQKRAPPNKWGNLELMKIPNFLHLTPPVIKRQCEALKSELVGIIFNCKLNWFGNISYFLQDFAPPGPKS